MCMIHVCVWICACEYRCPWGSLGPPELELQAVESLWYRCWELGRAVSLMLCFMNLTIRYLFKNIFIKFWEFHICIQCILSIFTLTRATPNSSWVHLLPHPLYKFMSLFVYYLIIHWIQSMFLLYIRVWGPLLALGQLTGDYTPLRRLTHSFPAAINCQ